LTEPLPVTTFIRLRFNEPKIARIIENWPVPVDNLEAIAIKYAEDLGFFMVDASNQEMLIDLIAHVLKFSPEVSSLLVKARDMERKRREKRHSDI
jgi:hypothetical protein